MNMQAVCDADCRVRYWSMKCPGSTHDSFAWGHDDFMKGVLGEREGALFRRMRAAGYHLVGDEAYTPEHTLATPWPARTCVGKDRESRLAYNYYHSAARITIERTFGQLTKRYLILKRPFNGGLEATQYAPGLLLVVGVCVKLHNLAVDRGTYRKVTYHGPDISGEYESAGRAGMRRRNHADREGSVAVHTLLTSADDFLDGEEAHANVFPAGHEYAHITDWDDDYVSKMGKGGRRTQECDVRQDKTKEFKDAVPPVLRPRMVHW